RLATSKVGTAQRKVDGLAKDKKATPAQKTSAENDLNAAKAELAKLECKEGPADSGGQCKPGEAKDIRLATSKVGTAQRKVDGLAKDKKATPAQKTSAEKDLHTAQAELAKLECKEAPADSGGQCKPGEAKDIRLATSKVGTAQ